MPVTYQLQPNPVTPDPDDQKARVVPVAILEVDDIVARIVKRGTTVNEADVRAVLQLAFEEISDEVAGGNHVNTPLANFRPSVQGVFKSASDSFDGSRHTVKASITAGLLLSSKMTTARVEKLSGTTLSPEVVSFTDVNTSTSAQATPGSIGTLSGSQLKYNSANAGEGIYFVDVAGSKEFKVDQVAQRTEGSLMFIIPPALTPGTYQIEVRRAYTQAATLRSGSLGTQVSVK